jgi:hypothetical protein
MPGRLDNARRKIEMMVKGKDGRMKLKPFQSEPGQKKKARSSDAEAGEEMNLRTYFQKRHDQIEKP